MHDPSPPLRSKLKVTGVLVFMLCAVQIGIGYWMLFSNFATYDDEGYILTAARNYFLRGQLYDLVYTQYGPAFHVLMDGLQHLIGSPLTNTSARFLTLGLWLGTALSCAALVWRQTLSCSLTLFTLTGTFLYLYFIPDEPFHPGGLIIFGLALSLFLLNELMRGQRWMGMAVLAGGTAAGLTLCKINVGAFYLISFLGWGLLHATAARARRFAPPLVALGFIVFALLLMHSLVGAPWVQIYLLVFAGAVTSTLSVMPSTALVKIRHGAIFAATGLGLTLVVLLLVWSRGTSLGGLLEGVFFGPLRHASNYSFPAHWRPGTLPVAALSLVFLLWHRWLSRHRSDETADRLIVILRLVQLGALLLALALLMKAHVIGTVFSFVASFIWTWVVPLKSTPRGDALPQFRGLLASVLLLQYLHAYPVGGSQESWATFLFVPLVALGLSELPLWRTAGSDSSLMPRWGGKTLRATMTLVLVGKTGWVAFATHKKYSPRSALGLPGAEQLHLAEPLRTAYRVLTINSVVHADMLFSLPGMFSFNLWTDLPTPTPKNTTLWFNLLDATDQAAIEQALRKQPRACIIVQESLLELMRAGGITAHGPLREYIRENFTVVFRIEGFAFLAAKDRRVMPLNVANLTQKPSGETGADTQLDFCLPADGTPIASFEIKDMFNAEAPSLQVDATNAQITAARVDRTGRLLQTPGPVTWPLQHTGLTQFSLQFPRGNSAIYPILSVIYAKGADGKIIAEIRIAE